ncbi:uncharacterized protein ARMOST_00277 [Armillaria ostoyae]|uniref:Uncharacterized protein n=1 Tax=Armillaria ostoyae TaxID=47428 RepID=A0A284QKP1_ARMOS|nr:uncharacterized protein ARMOST_00277 [Armillaria ostoyae]
MVTVFILRRFQTGPRKTRAEREKEYRRTRVSPGYVLYYDLTSGSLDDRPIQFVCGLENLYRDTSNPSNVNELEKKLSVLEMEASVVIEKLHSDLASGKATLERRDVERLRKFLFVMHYRKPGGSSAIKPSTNVKHTLMRGCLEHGMEKVHFQMLTNVDPNMKHYEALAY